MERISRRGFLKLGGGLLLAGGTAISAIGLSNVYNTSSSLDQNKHDAEAAYPSVSSSQQVELALTNISRFRGESEKLARQGRLDEITQIFDGDKLVIDYEIVDYETHRQLLISQLQNRLTRERPSPMAFYILVTIAGLLPVALGLRTLEDAAHKENTQNVDNNLPVIPS